jgi:hypothetical protein
MSRWIRRGQRRGQRGGNAGKETPRTTAPPRILREIAFTLN